MTVIEKQYMESVISINRELKKPKEIDWEQRQWDLEARIFEKLVQEKMKKVESNEQFIIDLEERRECFTEEAIIAYRAAYQMLWQYRNDIEKGGDTNGKA